MFCKSCGTELPDGSLFCTNCGAKIEPEVAQAAPVVEPTPAPAVEPAPAPAQDYGYNPNPNPAPTYGYNPNPAPTYEQGAYGYYDNTAAMSAAPVAKAKGPAIAALVFGILALICCPLSGLFGLIGLILAIVALVKKTSKKGMAITGLILSILGAIIGTIVSLLVIIPTATAIVATGATVNEILENPDYYLNYDYDDYDYGYDDYGYDFDDYDFDYDYDVDDYDYNNNSSNSGSVDTYATSSSVEGYYEGSSEWVAVSGADELISYLEELYGRSLSESEKAGIRGDNDLNVTNNDCALYIYYDDSYAYADGDWDIAIDMGDYFGDQHWDSWDLLTYDEFRNGEYTKGFIDPSNGSFSLDVTEEDPSGEYAAQVFETSEEGNGIYGIKFSGTVYDNGDGTHSIDGTFEIMFMYGDMSEPYVQTHTYSITE